MPRGYCNGGSPSIEQCLNCPYDDCKYDDIVPERFPREHKKKRSVYIIRRVLRAKKGSVRTSYITSYTTARAHSSTVISKAMKFTGKEARTAIELIKGLVSDRSELTIVKRSEEIERIDSGEV